MENDKQLALPEYEYSPPRLTERDILRTLAFLGESLEEMVLVSEELEDRLIFTNEPESDMTERIASARFDMSEALISVREAIVALGKDRYGKK